MNGTLYINCDNNPITFNKKNYLLRAAERLGLTWIRPYTESDGEVDYLLNIQPCGLRRGKKWSGLWHIDVLLNSDLPHRFGEMDSAFVSSDQTIFPYEKQQVLFQACDPVLHRRIPEIEQEYDFVLCGSSGENNFYYKRAERAKILKEKFSYFDYGKDYTPEEYVKNYNHARVQWIQTCIGENNLKDGAAAQRFFECLAIGPILTNWTDDLPLTGLVEDQDYMAYRTDEEMVEKMERLVNNPELREHIFTNGRQKALLYHTYEHRLISILKAIDEHLATRTTQR